VDVSSGTIWEAVARELPDAVAICEPGRDRAYVGEAVALAVRARAEDRAPVVLPAVPLMHATGLFNAMGALLTAGRVVTARPGGLDPRHVWETVAEQRVRTIVVAGNPVCQPLVIELLAAEEAGRPRLPFAPGGGQLGNDAE
jgi:3-oxocholest-4-en-26-oate---CoA ligase